MAKLGSRNAIDGDVRTRLMRAAEMLLASSADGQISTREICAGAEVTSPTLYHHFKDKHALLDAVVLDGFTRYLEGKRAIARTGYVLEDFRTGWDMHVSFGCEHPAHYRLMFGTRSADHVAPAALLARDEVARTVAEWGHDGRLKVSVEAAMDTMSAAAVGVTLQLIAVEADSTHPISTNVRDTVARAIFQSAGIDDPVVDGVQGLAHRLLDVLPGGAVEPLRASETALLREWLESLAHSSQTTDRRGDA